MKTLIVYYSLEGNTDYAAKKIADRLGADTIRLEPVKAYRDKGIGKFVWGGRSVLMGQKPKLKKYYAHLSRYDRVILGFPVWAGSFAPPMRTFVTDHRNELLGKEIAVFACQSGRGAEKAFEKLKKLLGISEFEAEAVFIDPKNKQSYKTDWAIDAFSSVLVDEEEKPAAVKGIKKIAGAAGINNARDVAALVGRGLSNKKVRRYFFHWTYRKHAKLCTALHLGMYAFDMTVSYVICKKLLDEADRIGSR